MFKNNKNLLIIAIIAVVNALGYAIIIPILYSYSQRYGLNDFQNGLLFSIFSICQFISTPIIGRLSDKYGRRPLLIGSIAGTAISFFMMAFAPSAIFLFIARAIDGLTSGNIPVASAVISDTTEKDRAKGFGIIGASFGFGFVFGPAIAALTLGFGASVPFIIAGTVSVIAVIMTYLMLPETNKHLGEVKKEPLINVKQLLFAVTDDRVGMTLLVSLLYSLAFGLFIFAFQPVAKKVVMLTDVQVAVTFTIFGLMGVVSQVLVIPKITKMLGEKRSLIGSLMILAATFFGFYLTKTYPILIALSLIQAIANGFVAPLIQAILSKEVDMKSQGSMQGLNQSYVSLGFIVGPIVGGAIATYSIPMPFLLGSAIIAACVVLSHFIKVSPSHKVSAF
jgi:MFS family permease